MALRRQPTRIELTVDDVSEYNEVCQPVLIFTWRAQQKSDQLTT